MEDKSTQVTVRNSALIDPTIDLPKSKIRYRIPSVFLFTLLLSLQMFSQEHLRTQPGSLFSELIFPLNQKPTPQCHAPTIVSSGDRLLAAWFGGTEEKHPDVGIWLSIFDGTGWSKPKEVANGELPDGPRYPAWNPVLFQPSQGPLLLFYKVGPSPVEWWGMLVHSTNHGSTWSKPVRLPDGILGPIKNKPVQLDDRTLISASSTEHSGWQCHIEWTSDLGKTWNRTTSLVDDASLGAIQPTILVHPNSILQLLCRTRTGFLATSWSNDLARTWSGLQKTSLPNPNSGIDAVTLLDGRHLLVYNHVGKDSMKWGGLRSPLNVALSNDGRVWKPAFILEDAPGEFSYPAVIQTAKGLIHIVYTYRRESIKHVVLDPTVL